MLWGPGVDIWVRLGHLFVAVSVVNFGCLSVVAVWVSCGCICQFGPVFVVIFGCVSLGCVCQLWLYGSVVAVWVSFCCMHGQFGPYLSAAAVFVSCGLFVSCGCLWIWVCSMTGWRARFMLWGPGVDIWVRLGHLLVAVSVVNFGCVCQLWLCLSVVAIWVSCGCMGQFLLYAWSV